MAMLMGSEPPRVGEIDGSDASSGRASGTDDPDRRARRCRLPLPSVASPKQVTVRPLVVRKEGRAESAGQLACSFCDGDRVFEERRCPAS